MDCMAGPFAGRTSTSSSASRAAGSSSAPPSPIGSAPASPRYESRASCRPRRVHASYALEYGTDTLDIHDDAVRKGQRVLIVDDLLATGGTAKATLDLVNQLGGHVHALAFLIELVALNGRQRLTGQTLHTVLQVPDSTSLILLVSAAIVVAAVLIGAAQIVARCARTANRPRIAGGSPLSSCLRRR